MYNIKHLKRELKEFEIDFYNYKNILLKDYEKLKKSIKMHFYLSVIERFEIAIENESELYNFPTQDEIDKITLNKLFEDYWKNEDPGYFNIDNSETIENFLSNYWKEKYYKN